MITVSEVVLEIIKRTPFLEVAFNNDLINFSSFARFYRKQIERQAKKPVKAGAIVMALRRLPIAGKSDNPVNIIFRKPREMIVRSDLFELTLKHTASLPLMKKLGDMKKTEENKFLTVTEGVFETTIIASTDLKEHILKNVDLSAVVSEINGLCSVTIRLGEDNIRTPGVYYDILKQLAWEKINVIEVVSTTNEISIILSNDDVDKAFALLKNLYS